MTLTMQNAIIVADRWETRANNLALVFASLYAANPGDARAKKALALHFEMKRRVRLVLDGIFEAKMG